MKIIPIVYNHEFVFNSSLSGMLHPGNYRYYINTSNFSLFYDSAIFLPVLVLKPRGLMQFFFKFTMGPQWKEENKFQSANAFFPGK